MENKDNKNINHLFHQMRKDEPKATSGITKVNVIWVISLLVIIIIALLACIILDLDQVTNADVIINYISNASLLLSIVLSIFAIQYTYYSNIQIQSQFEKINSAASHIEETSVELNHINRKLDESIEEILQKLGTMDTKMDNLNTNNMLQAHEVSNV